MILMILVIVSLLALVGMRNIQTSGIRYGKVTPEAVPSQVCPGDSFLYNVHVEVKHPDTVVLLTEDWCKPSTNICPKEFVIAPVYHNAKEPFTVDTSATRYVPTAMPPGEWEFRHCNTATSDEGTSVACYYVPLTVLDCANRSN